MKSAQPLNVLTAIVASYGLRWSIKALQTEREVAPQAQAGDREAQQSVTQRPEAKLFGIPNAVYGIIYYAGLIFLLMVRQADAKPWRAIVKLAALSAFGRTITLLGSLLKTRTWCPVCMRAHTVNSLLAILVLRRQAR